jgi:predicted RecB family nuclease
MSPSAIISEEIFCAYLKCKYKAYLKLQGTVGEVSEYERLLAKLDVEYRKAAGRVLFRAQSKAAFSLHGPILFTAHEHVTTDDRLRLAFAASILGRVRDTQPESGRIIHGPNFKTSRIALPRPIAKVHNTISQIQALQQSATPPPLILNRHCSECEFRRSCRAVAVEKDDLSLLRGLNAKQITGLNQRGIFTVTQYSHTFRPARMRRVAEKAFRKHDASLQALAIREKKVYVAQRTPILNGKVRIYLDVEALPDPDRYYLIGLLIVESDSNRRMKSFWADRAADEPAVWATFLRTMSEIGEDFVIFHYGSYESRFLRRMAKLHGGDPALIERIESRSVNVLSPSKSPTHCVSLHYRPNGRTGSWPKRIERRPESPSPSRSGQEQSPRISNRSTTGSIVS